MAGTTGITPFRTGTVGVAPGTLSALDPGPWIADDTHWNVGELLWSYADQRVTAYVGATHLWPTDRLIRVFRQDGSEIDYTPAAIKKLFKRIGPAYLWPGLRVRRNTANLGGGDPDPTAHGTVVHQIGCSVAVHWDGRSTREDFNYRWNVNGLCDIEVIPHFIDCKITPSCRELAEATARLEQQYNQIRAEEYGQRQRSETAGSLSQENKQMMQAAWTAELRRISAASEAEQARRDRDRVQCQSQFDLED